jgi:hypothetical protein
LPAHRNRAERPKKPLAAVDGHRTPPWPARYLVGGRFAASAKENLTGDNTTRTATVAPRPQDADRIRQTTSTCTPTKSLRGR